MAWKVDRKKCLRCGACVSVCPKHALSLGEHGLENDRSKCISCGICKKACPAGSIEVEK